MLTRIGWTPLLSEPWSRAAAATARFAGESRVLPTMLRAPMVAHALSSRMPSPPRLRALVTALHGRLAVVNPPRPTRLPAGLIAALRGVIRAGGDLSALGAGEDRPADATPGSAHPPGSRRTRERRSALALVNALPASVRKTLTGDITWTGVALYEATTPIIWLDSSAVDAGPLASAGIAIVRIDYRVVLAFGRGIAPSWNSIDESARTAPHVAWPIHRTSRSRPAGSEDDTFTPWFVVALLVPDTWFAEHADADTLAQWARLTGRSDGPDRYWFPEAWERFLEPGRRVGWLTAYDVWRPRRGRLASATDRRDDPDPAAMFRPPLTLTPELERGVGVPPGYALVQAAGNLSVAITVLG